MCVYLGKMTLLDSRYASRHFWISSKRMLLCWKVSSRSVSDEMCQPEFMCDHVYLPLPAYTCLLVKFLSVLCGHLPGCVAALRALGILLAFAMISFQDLCTLRNILDSAGSCVLIPGAKKILSRNSQFLWHMSHSSWEGGKKEEREKEEIQGRLGKKWGQCKCDWN